MSNLVGQLLNWRTSFLSIRTGVVARQRAWFSFWEGGVGGGLLGSSLHSSEMVRRSGVTERIAL